MADSERVKIEEFKGLHVAYLREDAHGHNVTAAPGIRKLRSVAQQHKLHGPDAVFLSVINDNPNAAKGGEVRIDAAVSVAKGFQGSKEAGLAVRELAAGTHAVYRHVGSYKGLRDAWAHFASLSVPGYKVAGCRFMLTGSSMVNNTAAPPHHSRRYRC